WSGVLGAPMNRRNNFILGYPNSQTTKTEADNESFKHTQCSAVNSTVVIERDVRHGARRPENDKKRGTGSSNVCRVWRGNVQNVLRRLPWKGWQGRRPG